MMIKKAEKITDADDLKNAKEQRQAMANFRPWDHRAPARRQSGLLSDCRPLCNLDVRG